VGGDFGFAGCSRQWWAVSGLAEVGGLGELHEVHGKAVHYFHYLPYDLEPIPR
jgi:hypothetical protein